MVNRKTEQSGKTKVPISIGSRFKKVRKSLGMSQVQFFTPLRISQPHYSEVESGKTRPSGLLVAMVCCYYGVNTEWMEKGKGKMFLPVNKCKVGSLVNKEGTVPYYEETLPPDFLEMSHCFYARIPGIPDGAAMFKTNAEYPGHIVKGDFLIVRPVTYADITAGMFLMLLSKNREECMIRQVVIQDDELFLSTGDLDLPLSKFPRQSFRHYSVVTRIISTYRRIDLNEGPGKSS